MENVTACVLLHGDYPILAQRCLSSLRPHFRAPQIRVYGNAVSETTAKYVQSLISTGMLAEQNVDLSPENRLKYPVLREAIDAVRTDKIMWFDDDSFITTIEPGWLRSTLFATRHAAIAGAMLEYRFLSPAQQKWIAVQPWYAGLAQPRNPRFVVGGWWLADVANFRRHKWPPTELRHRGGDVMFGVLCYQQRLKMQHYIRDLAINADMSGTSHKSPRRTYDEPPLGSNYTETPV